MRIDLIEYLYVLNFSIATLAEKIFVLQNAKVCGTVQIWAKVCQTMKNCAKLCITR